MGANTRVNNLLGMFQFRMAVATAGTPEVLGPKLADSTIAFVNGGEDFDTITDSSSRFLINGFEVGDIITITGASNGANNSTFEIRAVTAGTITLTVKNTLTDEAAAASVVMKADKVVPEGIVIDIKARNGNTDLIHVGRSSASALSTNSQSFTLRNNEDIQLQVNTLNSIWLDAVVDGEGVEVVFEKNPRT